MPEPLDEIFPADAERVLCGTDEKDDGVVTEFWAVALQRKSGQRSYMVMLDRIGEDYAPGIYMVPLDHTARHQAAFRKAVTQARLNGFGA